MKREEINTYLYNQYISTGNVNFLHQIIHDYDKFIYKTILETLIENKISSVNPEECYSYVYYDIFKHLEKMSVNNVSPLRIGLSIKRWTLSSMVRFIEEEKLLTVKLQDMKKRL